VGSHVRVSTCAKSPARLKIGRASITVLAVQSRMPNRNFVVATANLLLLKLGCMLFSPKWDIWHAAETITVYFGYVSLGPHVQLQIIKRNHSCRQGCTWELTLLRQFLPGMDLYRCATFWTFPLHSEQFFPFKGITGRISLACYFYIVLIYWYHMWVDQRKGFHTLNDQSTS